MDSVPQTVIDHHTLHGEFKLSNGGASDTYIDLRAAILCPLCDLSMWYAVQLDDLFHGVRPFSPVATGSFGALLLGALSEMGWCGTLWNPKGHGVEWSGDQEASRVVLLDDVVTTGGTLRALRAACEAQGWEVVGEIVAVRRD